MNMVKFEFCTNHLYGGLVFKKLVNSVLRLVANLLTSCE